MTLTSGASHPGRAGTLVHHDSLISATVSKDADDHGTWLFSGWAREPLPAPLGLYTEEGHSYSYLLERKHASRVNV
jgi:hypothetical protein